MVKLTWIVMVNGTLVSMLRCSRSKVYSTFVVRSIPTYIMQHAQSYCKSFKQNTYDHSDKEKKSPSY